MLIHLHSQATTTPKIRTAIQRSDEAGTVLAERFGVTPQTVYKWRNRDSIEDRPHTPSVADDADASPGGPSR
jgi:transposase-like protein